jgi:hypothetical protein
MPLDPATLPTFLTRSTLPHLSLVSLPAGLAAFPALVDGESTASRMARRQAYHACWGSLSAHIDVRRLMHLTAHVPRSCVRKGLSLQPSAAPLHRCNVLSCF